MAQRRLISRSLGSSRKFHALYERAGKLAEFAQSLYPLLVCNADDFGRLPGDAFTVKHSVLPISPRKTGDFDSALVAMHDVGLILLYEANGNRYIEIQDFDKHQSGLHKRTESKYPTPTDKSKIPGISRNFQEIPPELNRTELNRTEEKQSYSSEPCGSSPSASAANSQGLIHIPLNTGEEFPVTESMIGEFRSLYPAVDVEQELRNMRGWCIANPTKRKTRKGVTKFINGWLARAQDKSPTSSGQKNDVFEPFKQKRAEV